MGLTALTTNNPSVEEFLRSLTPEDEYWVGYLRADGTLVSTKNLNNTVVRFVQVHEEPVQKFSEYIQSKAIHTSQGTGFENSGLAYITQTANKARMYKALGLKTEELPQLFFDSTHFWRGMIDGDGTVACYSAPVLQLVGTYFDMKKFVDFLDKIGVRANVYKHQMIFRVIFKGNQAIAAIRKIYGSGPSYLLYKRKKAEFIMSLEYSRHFNANKVQWP